MGGLDEKLGGGIPAGSTVLLISNQEGPVRLFCEQIAYILGTEGHRIFYFTIVRDPAYIREEMMVYEWDTTEMEQGRQWTFIDAYSPRVQSLQQGGHGPQSMGTGLLAPGAMSPGSRSLGADLFVTLRREILSQLDEGDIVMIDSLSDLLVNHDAASVRELLEILGARFTSATVSSSCPSYQTSTIHTSSPLYRTCPMSLSNSSLSLSTWKASFGFTR